MGIEQSSPMSPARTERSRRWERRERRPRLLSTLPRHLRPVAQMFSAVAQSPWPVMWSVARKAVARKAVVSYRWVHGRRSGSNHHTWRSTRAFHLNLVGRRSRRACPDGPPSHGDIAVSITLSTPVYPRSAFTLFRHRGDGHFGIVEDGLSEVIHNSGSWRLRFHQTLWLPASLHGLLPENHLSRSLVDLEVSRSKLANRSRQS